MYDSYPSFLQILVFIDLFSSDYRLFLQFGHPFIVLRSDYGRVCYQARNSNVLFDLDVLLYVRIVSLSMFSVVYL